jgi:3-oxoacyl-[acyl-carrier protein] reductase
MSDSTSIALVTGGNRGIGSAIAKSLKAAGYTVIVTYRSGSAPADFESVQLDVTSTESVDTAFALIEEKWGTPEIVVCNAGITKDTLSMRMSDEDFADVIDANLTGAFRTARRATKGLLKLKRGRLIFIGSVVGLSGSAGQVNYSASKAGLVGMARVAACVEASRRPGVRARLGRATHGARDVAAARHATPRARRLPGCLVLLMIPVAGLTVPALVPLPLQGHRRNFGYR